MYNLPHNVMCASKCSCSTHEHRQASANPETGDVGIRVIAQQISGSVHLQPGESVTLPDAAEKCPDIAGARSRGEIRIETPSQPAVKA